MIWVNTDTEITEWIFGAKNPYISENLYTKDGITSGSYLNSSGAAATYSNWSYTQPIPLPENTISVTIITSSTTSTNPCHIFYDANGTVVSSVLRGTGANTYSIPENVTAIALSVHTSDSPSIMATYVVDGSVWIQTDVNKNAGSFNVVTGDNVININPICCWQYVDGELVSKSAQSYINGAWTGWYTYLYNQGDTCDALTGGWERQKDKAVTTPAAPAITYNETTMTASIYHNGSSNFWGGWIRPVNGIDLTNYSTVTCKSVSHAQTSRIVITNVDATSIGSSGGVAKQTISTTGTTTLNISNLSGLYDVGIYVYAGSGGTAKVEISQIYLS